MLYNKNNLAVAEIAAKESNPEVLSGVFFTPESTVATNAVSLLEVSVSDNVKVDNFPKFPNGKTAMRGYTPRLHGLRCFGRAII